MDKLVIESDIWEELSEAEKYQAISLIKSLEYEKKMAGRKRKASNGDIALYQKAAKVAKQIEAKQAWAGTYYGKKQYMPRSPGGQIVSEMKYSDQFLSGGAITSGTSWAGSELDPATTNCLFAPGPGTAINQRIGRKVHMFSLKMKGTVNCAAQINQTAAEEACDIRLILYQDKQTNTLQSQGEDLISAASAVSLVSLNGFMNLANLGKFKVWKEKRFVMHNPTISWDGTNMEQSGLVRNFKMNIKFKTPIVVNFNATGGTTVADIVDNSFHLIGMCSNGALVPALSYHCRVGYKD